jgi:hypothetical protein
MAEQQWDHQHYTCICCGESFGSFSEMMEHMSREHTEEEVLYALQREESELAQAGN